MSNKPTTPPPFTPEEHTTLFECARIALQPGEMFDRLCHDMDIDDAVMIALRDRLETYMDDDKVTFRDRILSEEETIELEKAAVCKDWNPEQGWEDHDDPIDYCSRQPNPPVAAKLLARANIAMHEVDWAIHFLMQCPKVWPKPELNVLQVAARYLSKEYQAEWEFPGYLNVVHEGITFSFGDDNEDRAISYNYEIPSRPGYQIGGLEVASGTLSCVRIAEFIYEQVQAVAKLVAVNKNRFHAVPVIVYVPIDEENPEGLVIDRLHDEEGVVPLIATDYATTTVELTEGHEHAARITGVCKLSRID